LDLDVNKKISKYFNYTGNLSLLKGTNLSEEIPLIHMPSINFANTISYKNEDFNQLTIGLNQRTVLQQNQFPDYNFTTFNAISQEDVFLDISSTPPTYTVFNFNSSMIFKAFKKGSLKLEFNIDNLFNVSYRENLNRLRYFANELGRNFNIFPVWEYNQINAQIFGLDLDVNKKISKYFNYTGNLSLLKGTNLSEDIPLIHMPSTNFANTISYKNEDFNQLTIGLKQRTVLQQNQFPDYNFSTFNAISQENVFVDISSTPPTYTVFNFNSSMIFKAFRKGSLKLEFNIDNLFNVSYRENLNRLRYFADELGRNFNIKLKINY